MKLRTLATLAALIVGAGVLVGAPAAAASPETPQRPEQCQRLRLVNPEGSVICDRGPDCSFWADVPGYTCTDLVPVRTTTTTRPTTTTAPRTTRSAPPRTVTPAAPYTAPTPPVVEPSSSGGGSGWLWWMVGLGVLGGGGWAVYRRFGAGVAGPRHGLHGDWAGYDAPQPTPGTGELFSEYPAKPYLPDAEPEPTYRSDGEFSHLDAVFGTDERS